MSELVAAASPLRQRLQAPGPLGVSGIDVLIAVATVTFSAIVIIGSPQRFDSGWPELAAGVGAFVAVTFRRRWTFPLLALSLAWTTVHVLALQRPTPTLFATFVLLATATIRLDRRPAIALGVAVGLVLYTVALLSIEVEFGDGRAMISIVWSAAAVGIGDAIRSWRRYRESAEAQLHSAVVASEAQARERVIEERLNIARELHDLLAHSLSVANVQTGAALYLLRSDPDQAEVSLRAARDAGRTVLDELSELLAVLRHDEVDEGSASEPGTGGAPRSSLPTIDDIPTVVETMRTAGLAVTHRESGTPQLMAPAASLAAYRVVQEALTNAAKHGTGEVDLSIAWQPARVTITVTNAVGPRRDGQQTPSGGLGLVGMRERVTSQGGVFQSGQQQGRFEVSAVLPTSPVSWSGAEHGPDGDPDGAVDR